MKANKSTTAPANNCLSDFLCPKGQDPRFLSPKTGFEGSKKAFPGILYFKAVNNG
jgi:hypothetical protein